ncbi:MAG: hypothetical protein JO214_02350 [Frankiaceae bacterium]|nr:hypothetical protein [Frankiaceae bacterium]
MWPERGEALSRTIEAEAALADLYADALNQWVTSANHAVLVASSAPPNTQAVDQTGQVWDQLASGLILAGLSSLWAISLMEALEGLGIPLPDLPEDQSKTWVDAKVLRAITTTSDVTRERVLEAVARVDHDDRLREAREDFVARTRPAVAATPAIIREKVAAAVRDIPRADEPTVEVVIVRQREAAASVLSAGSPALRDVARYQGYQAAGVQNAAVIHAARQSEDADLQKTWIATIDGKTRDTHFAADGQRTPLDGSFTVGRASLRFPGDPDGPPEEVRNCRCRVGVLAADEELPDEVDRHTERLGGRDSTARNRQGSQADEIARREREGVVRARDDEDGVGHTGTPAVRTAAGGWTAPSEQEHDMPKPSDLLNRTTFVPEQTTSLADTQATEGETYRTFSDQPIAFVGIETSDGRMLAADIALTFRTFPLPLMWVKQTGYGHEDAFTVGVLESAAVVGDQVQASGYLLNTAEADEAAGLLGHGVTGPSVDLAATEWKLCDEDGKEITEEDWWDMPMDAHVIQTITAAELIGTTLVATPAFGDTKLELNAERETRAAALVASAADAFQPRVYSAELFADPGLTEPTELQIDTETGRVFGHLACFGACHRSVQSQCVIAPRSPSSYAMFHTSPAVRLDNGTRLPVGRLTVGTGHAPDSLRPGPALAHYDNTGACWALVRAGEDSHGIWVSGVVAPWATPEQVEQALAAPLSGDWRDFGQGLDLIAALNVNTPGFVVRGRDGSNGRPAALVASIGPAPAAKKRSAPITADALESIVEAAVRKATLSIQRQAAAEDLLEVARTKVGPAPEPPTREEETAALLARAGSL